MKKYRQCRNITSASYGKYSNMSDDDRAAGISRIRNTNLSDFPHKFSSDDDLYVAIDNDGYAVIIKADSSETLHYLEHYGIITGYEPFTEIYEVNMSDIETIFEGRNL